MVRTLVVGATGDIGVPLALALIEEGHNVFALIRSSSRTAKAAQVSRIERAGAQVVSGDLTDAHSLQAVFDLLHPIEAVVCAVAGQAYIAHIRCRKVAGTTCVACSDYHSGDVLPAGEQLLNQQHLISASLKCGTVKRFLPSEFSYDLTAGSTTTPELFEPKRKIQKLLQETNLPYTIVSSNGFMEHWYPGLGVLGQTYPPDPVLVFGDGNVKGLANAMQDIVTYAAKALVDPRTENKRVIVCPSVNQASQNDLIALWERISGQKLSRKVMSAEELDQQIKEGTLSMRTSDNYSNETFLKLVKGFWIDGEAVQPIPVDGVRAAALYPEVPITTVESYLTDLFEQGPQKQGR